MKNQIINISIVNVDDIESVTVLKKNFPLFEFFHKSSRVVLHEVDEISIKQAFIIEGEVDEIEMLIEKFNKNNFPFAIVIKRPTDAIYGFKKNAIYCVQAPLTIEKISIILLKVQSFYFRV